MPLIRLVNHHPKNPHHIDKMIVIKGLPEEWILNRKADGTVELQPPWEADIDANIPVAIRHFCEPMMITFKFPPIHKEALGITDQRKILGFRLDYSRQPVRELWERIEKYIDATLPRDLKIPEPKMVAKDHKEPFSLDPEQMPVVDLRPKEAVSTPAVVVAAPKPAEELAPRPKEPVQDNYCEVCNKTFLNKQALRMHNTKKHREDLVRV